MLDIVLSSWIWVNDIQYIVRSVLLYKVINIRLRLLIFEQEESERMFRGIVYFLKKKIFLWLKQISLSMN